MRSPRKILAELSDLRFRIHLVGSEENHIPRPAKRLLWHAQNNPVRMSLNLTHSPPNKKVALYPQRLCQIPLITHTAYLQSITQNQNIAIEILQAYQEKVHPSAKSPNRCYPLDTFYE
ncbi:hypothetical protein PSE_1470 [Pseudovibrio sp. FO-BEG1]|nr:hypothetical protein PSE_1470 [Pseudovibrio sp. FO-BEG1]